MIPESYKNSNIQMYLSRWILLVGVQDDVRVSIVESTIVLFGPVSHLKNMEEFSNDAACEGEGGGV